jgi:hypothetical protein
LTEAQHEYDYGAAVYGSILVAALVGAMFEDSSGPRSMTLSLLGSILAFWLAHVWSAVIGERVSEGRRFKVSRVRSIAVDQWPLVEAGLLPGLLIAIAWMGGYSRHTGVVLALAVAIVQLVGWGMFAGHRVETTWARALLVGLFDGGLGLAIVAFEIGVHRL